MQKSLSSTLTILLLATVTIFSSCKKDKEASTQEKIVGKWTLEAAYLDYSLFGMAQKDTISGSAGDYIQINADGTVTGSGESQVATGTWTLVDNKLVIKETGDEDDAAVGYEIKKVSSSELQLYNKEIEGQDYWEITLHLKK